VHSRVQAARASPKNHLVVFTVRRRPSISGHAAIAPLRGAAGRALHGGVLVVPSRSEIRGLMAIWCRALAARARAARAGGDGSDAPAAANCGAN